MGLRGWCITAKFLLRIIVSIRWSCCLLREDLCDLVLILCVIVGILCVSGGPSTTVLSSVVVNEDATTLLDGNNGLAAVVVALVGFTLVVLQKMMCELLYFV